MSDTDKIFYEINESLLLSAKARMISPLKRFAIGRIKYLVVNTYTIVWGSRPAVWRRSRGAPSFCTAFTERSPQKSQHKRREAQTRVSLSRPSFSAQRLDTPLRRRAASCTSNNRLVKVDSFETSFNESRVRSTTSSAAPRRFLAQRPRSAASRARLDCQLEKVGPPLAVR